MKLTHLLNRFAFIPSKEAQIMLKNRQISLNGEVIYENRDITFVDEKDVENNGLLHAGDFVAQLIKNDIWKHRLLIFGLENLFNSNIDNNLTKHLKKFSILKISKKQIFILKNNE